MLARIKGWLIAAIMGAAALAAAFLKGRASGKAQVKAQSDAAYRKTRERIDHATKNLDHLSDGDVAERLRRHADQ